MDVPFRMAVFDPLQKAIAGCEAELGMYQDSDDDYSVAQAAKYEAIHSLLLAVAIVSGHVFGDVGSVEVKKR